VSLVDPQAATFYDKIVERAFVPQHMIDVLPDHRLLYITVPKAACSRVRATLIHVMRPGEDFDGDVHVRKASGLPGPRQVGVIAFHRLATDPRTLRFSFVRNPYDRLVSCWADKFQDRPLVRGQRGVIDHYLRVRAEIDPGLPAGSDRTLSFADFITVATSTADRRIDGHWNLQTDIIDVPGIPLDMIGRVESFHRDIVRVLDHAGAGGSLRARSLRPVNASRRGRCADYYDSGLADRVHRAYARDFDAFRYPRALPV
jgi:hypothetical protein